LTTGKPYDASVRVLVTGGAGFIGSNLCEHLRRESVADDVIVLDDLSTGDAANLSAVDAELVVGTLLDRDVLDRVVSGIDAVVHLGALGSVPRSIERPVATHEANTTGTLNLLEAIRRAGTNPHVIVASSSSVYGANPELPKREELATLPLSPYAASKLATEVYALAYGHSYGLPVLAFRFFNVFGPRQPAGHAYAAVVPAFLSAIAACRPLTVFGDGKQSRDFTYVGTVCRVLADALRRGVSAPGPVNLAYGTRTDLLSLIVMIEAIIGRPVAVEHTEPRRGDVRHSQADATLLRSLFPDVVPTPLEEALRATCAWFGLVNDGS
jgi:UDP-glucose 4-epimerase